MRISASRASGVRRALAGCALAAAASAVLHAPSSAARQPIRLGGRLSVGSTYDTNLEHRPTGVETVGLEMGGELRMLVAAGPFTTSLQHEVALHRYRTLSERDRTSHKSRAVLDVAASSAVLFRTAASASFAGLSEDREVGTEYGVTEALDVRFDERNRIRLTGGYSRRQYGERSGRDATNWSIGVGYTVGDRQKAALALSTKYDWNETPDPRGEFHRWTHRVEFRAPLPGSELSVGVARIGREYPNRLVELEEVRDLELGEAENDILDAYVLQTGTPRGSIPIKDVLPAFPDRWRDLPRRDEIWTPAASLTLLPGRTLEIELAYEFEIRLSTDLRRGYSGHTLGLVSRVGI